MSFPLAREGHGLKSCVAGPEDASSAATNRAASANRAATAVLAGEAVLAAKAIQVGRDALADEVPSPDEAEKEGVVRP